MTIIISIRWEDHRGFSRHRWQQRDKKLVNAERAIGANSFVVTCERSSKNHACLVRFWAESQFSADMAHSKSPADQPEVEKDSIVAASRSDDAHEGIAAFADKRHPQLCGE
jgi:hypothetical protein